MISIPTPYPYKLDIALSSAGYSIHQHLENGVLSWIYDTTQETAIQAFINAYNGLPQAQADAISLVDQAASDARARYLTVGVGQDATYQLKLADAQSVLAGGTPGPMISQEATATGVTPAALAQVVVNTYNGWLAKAASIEAARMGAKSQINAITNQANWAQCFALAQTAVANIGAM